MRGHHRDGVHAAAPASGTLGAQGDRRTERFARGERVREFEAFKQQAERRLQVLEDATSKNDLMHLPGNRFEALGGDREGQFSIRINQQWRVCFELPDTEARPFNIEITDYH
ncbi:MAG: type II toxin-antitoxin system RelE/ParE family toxin [Armatimonadetes bacterium]|nr:type II toxin-antitoxin system RelE/ParE family toxin [Armatimonadota bacterium]